MRGERFSKVTTPIVMGLTIGEHFVAATGANFADGLKFKMRFEISKNKTSRWATVVDEDLARYFANRPVRMVGASGPSAGGAPGDEDVQMETGFAGTSGKT